jgi:hypothetical protein
MGPVDSRVQFVNAFTVDIETDDRQAAAGKSDSNRQANIAQTDNGNDAFGGHRQFQIQDLRKQ